MFATHFISCRGKNSDNYLYALLFAARAERNQSSGSGSPTSFAVDKAAVVLDDGTTPEVDLTTLSEGQLELLMSLLLAF